MPSKNRFPVTVSEKLCKKCGEVKPASGFGRDARLKTGLLSWCRACRNEANKARGDPPAAVHDIPDAKVCRRCQTEKPAPEFYAQPRNRDCLREYCKACERVVHASRVLTQEQKTHRYKVKMEWERGQPDKRSAWRSYRNARKAGRIVPGPCERCASTEDIHAHHEDYSKPLDVVWLCRKHHNERHAEMRAAVS